MGQAMRMPMKIGRKGVGLEGWGRVVGAEVGWLGGVVSGLDAEGEGKEDMIVVYAWIGLVVGGEMCEVSRERRLVYGY